MGKMVHSNEGSKKTTYSSPKAVVGEIDTRAPFHSVKDAVNLFGEKPAVKKAKPQSAEKVLVKQTQLHLARKELNKLQDQLQNAENTKSQALIELEKAKQTVEELSHRLKLFTASKDAAIQAKEDSESEREQYSKVLSELNSAKQELAKIRQDYDSSVEAKATATNEAEKIGAEENFVRASELSEEISAMKETIEQVKQAKIFAEKEFEKQSYKTKLEEYAKKMVLLKEGFDPDAAKNLEIRLAEATTEIEGLKKEVDGMNSVKTVTCELDGAKESLKKVLEEEKLLRNVVESLEKELENLRKEHSELREKEAETESVTGNLHVKVRICKSELETALAEEVKVNGASGEMIATVNRLIEVAEKAKRESEEMKIEVVELKKEAEETRLCLEEAETQLILSEMANKITISRDEFWALSKKASEKEALERLEAARKEIEDVKAATREALKKAEMDEAAKKAVESELRRWREREKKVAEAASRILAQYESGVIDCENNNGVAQE